METAGLGDTDSDSGETSETVTASDGTSTTGATGSGSSPSTDPSDPSDPSDPTTDPSDPTTDPTDPTTDPSDPTTDPTDPTTGSDTDPTEGTAAMVTVSGNDFGDVEYETIPTRDYTLTNEGGQTADNLSLVMDGPFLLDFDDCPDDLGPGDSCTATVSHNAATLGPFSGGLLVGYDSMDGPDDVTRELTADVTGETENLIDNPGFENCDIGASPAGWLPIAGGGLYCGGSWATPHQGSRFLSGGGPDENQDVFESRLEVDLSPYIHAIGTGLMTFEFEGYAATTGENNDLYRLRVRFRTGGGVNREQINTGLLTGAIWTPRGDGRTVSTDVEEARIDLRCEKSGGFDCDAFFDTLSLVGRYEP